jgi:hypothetical protein
MEEKKEYKCTQCDKFYKNYKSLWKHNYIYHKHQNNFAHFKLFTFRISLISQENIEESYSFL